MDDEQTIRLKKHEIAELKSRADKWSTLTKDEKATQKLDLAKQFLTKCGYDPTDPYKVDSLRGKITQWFSNNTSSSQNRLPGLIKANWTAQQVYDERHAEEIKERQAALIATAAAKGHKVYPIAAFNKVRGAMWKGLSDEEQLEWMEEADRWTQEGPDPLSRLEVVKKRLPGWVESFFALLWDQGHVMAEITMCHVGENGKIVRSSYDITEGWHRQDKNTRTFSNVREPSATFVRFCRSVLIPKDADDENDEEEEIAAPKVRTKYVLIPLEFFPEGDPILPRFKDIRLQFPKQDTFRRFITAHYALACGMEGVSVPWGALSANMDTFLVPGSVEDGVVLHDPSRMPEDILRPIWRYICERQNMEDPELRFRFAKYHDPSTDQFFDAKYDSELEAKKLGPPAKKRKMMAPPPSYPWRNDAPTAGDSPLAPVAANVGPTKRTAPRPALARPTKSRQPATATTRGEEAGVDKQQTTNRPRTSARHRKATSKKSPNHDLPKRNNTGRTLRDKGKGVARHESDSAKSSGAEASDAEPPVESNGSGDDFDFGPVGGLFAPDDADDMAGPSGTRHSDDAFADAVQRSPRYPARDSPLANAATVDLWAPEHAAAMAVPPDDGLCALANRKPPCWVEHVGARLFPFLWSLAGEAQYHDGLAGWRHMLRRRASFKEHQVGEWATWDYGDQALPMVVHQSAENWTRFLEWIRDAAPKPTSTASEVQQWFLVVGMAIRDVHVRNEVEEDCEVPHGWPEYIRHSPADLGRDVIRFLEPLLTRIPRPLENVDGAAIVLPGTHPKRARPGVDQHMAPAVAPEPRHPGVPTRRNVKRNGCGPPGIPASAMRDGKEHDSLRNDSKTERTKRPLRPLPAPRPIRACADVAQWNNAALTSENAKPGVSGHNTQSAPRSPAKPIARIPPPAPQTPAKVNARGRRLPGLPHSSIPNANNQGDRGVESTIQDVVPSPARARPIIRPKAKRGPPGIPASSFDSVGNGMLGGTDDSAAKVEGILGDTDGAARGNRTGAGEPRSISEGIAVAQARDRGRRPAEVPIVVIDSTIVDRLKRRRKLNDAGIDGGDRQAPDRPVNARQEVLALARRRSKRQQTAHKRG